eukprot:Pgem_evm1s5230
MPLEGKRRLRGSHLLDNSLQKVQIPCRVGQAGVVVTPRFNKVRFLVRYQAGVVVIP